MGSTGAMRFTVSRHPCFAGRVEWRRRGFAARPLLHVSSCVYLASSFTAELQPVLVGDRPDPCLQLLWL